jgi:hypothetical protein
MRLNALFLQIRKQNKTSNIKDIADIGQSIWLTPRFILIYLANTIRARAPKPVYGKDDRKPVEMQASEHNVDIKFMPWNQFKHLLFDIYDHRIENAPEINGAINTTYLALEEHLVLFFVEKYHNLPRDQVEMQLLEFLATLKYYTGFWKRAKSFCLLYGLLKSEDSYLGGRKSAGSDCRFPSQLNDGRIAETEVLNYDIFA